MPLFRKEDFVQIKETINNTSYDNSAPELEIYQEHWSNLKNLAQAIFKKLSVEDSLREARKERFNKQAGYGATYQNWKEYILVGFNRSPESLGKMLFLKFAIHDMDVQAHLTIEVDVDRSSKTQMAPIELRNYVDSEKENHKYHEVLNFELEVEDYAESLLEASKDAISYLDQCTNYHLAQKSNNSAINSLQNTDRVTFYPLNQILYGPPGTGKTYQTINKAIEICNPSFDLSQERKAVKDEFDRLMENGQVVFTTFHQSLSYEDFIEGLKPKSDEGKIMYEVEDGLFKKLVNKANPDVGNFDTILEGFKKEISEPDGKPITIEAKGTTFDVKYRGTNVFYVQPHFSEKENPWYPVNIANIRQVFESSSYEGVYNPTYVREILNHLQNEKGLIKGIVDINDTPKNYVMIIDEINRGNVSQVFGELITLIETEKRTGADEALSVTLPYSEKKFSVPPNLYLVGTMNTADRSVEALDVALRRRFSFSYVGPDPNLPQLKHLIGDTGKTLSDLLTVINIRLTYLKDEDHQIGHSYLMGKESPEALADTFERNIIPLLKEFFYNDYGKIRLVLGDGFVEKRSEQSAPTMAVEDPDDMVVPSVAYTLRPIDEGNILQKVSQVFADE